MVLHLVEVPLELAHFLIRDFFLLSFSRLLFKFRHSCRLIVFVVRTIIERD